MPKATFDYTPDFLAESFRRYRRQHGWYVVSFSVRLVGAVLFGGYGLSLLWLGAVSGGVALLGLAALIFYTDRFRHWALRRSFEKSPYFGEAMTLELSEAGFHFRSSKSEARLDWSVFTKVVHFPDGVLLFQGPKAFNWIPFSTLEDAAQIPVLEELLASKISTHRRIGRKA